MAHPTFRARRLRRGYSLGILVITVVAVVSSVLVFLRPRPERSGLQLWTFARNHAEAYAPLLDRWNAATPERSIQQQVFDGAVLQRRLLSAFRSNTPVGDLIEVHGDIASQIFAGPLETIGFVDLTDRLRSEGLLEQINPPSFSPWTISGRILGLPHDVHPVLLAYRSDLVEAAGIDVTQVETWDDFARVFAPLMAERGPDGRPRRYLINFWPSNRGLIDTLLLQAGGGHFGPNDELIIRSPTNERVLARLASWSVGPDRIAVDAPEFNPGANKLRIDGVVVASLMPDWLSGVWRRDLPQLSGRLRLMPLPAWERGGRRTSVQGGTMLGLAAQGQNVEAAWQAAKSLYLSPELWDSFYPTTGIIPPVRTLWDRPVFHRPDPFFSGQPAGALFIAQAPHVPRRSASPFLTIASTEVGNALVRVCAAAERDGRFDEAYLIEAVRRELAVAEAAVERAMRRNVFLSGSRRSPAP